MRENERDKERCKELNANNGNVGSSKEPTSQADFRLVTSDTITPRDKERERDKRR